MQMLAAVHVAPVYTVPAAVLLAAAVVWYWLRLGQTSVPASRRRIRRASLSLIFVTIPVIVSALSVVDPKQRASAYVVLWSAAVLCLLLIVVTAIFDALNNIRLHRDAALDESLTATAQLIRLLGRGSDGTSASDEADR